MEFKPSGIMPNWIRQHTAPPRTRVLAEAYLKQLYTPEGQEIVAKHFYRPRDPAVATKYADKLPQLPLFTVEEVFGGWILHCASPSLRISSDPTMAVLFCRFDFQLPANRLALASCAGVKREEIRSYPD
jgi:hypothetical protein